MKRVKRPELRLHGQKVRLKKETGNSCSIRISTDCIAGVRIRSCSF